MRNMIIPNVGKGMVQWQLIHYWLNTNRYNNSVINKLGFIECVAEHKHNLQLSNSISRSTCLAHRNLYKGIKKLSIQSSTVFCCFKLENNPNVHRHERTDKETMLYSFSILYISKEEKQ